MKTWKRFIALFLACTLFSTTAYAQDLNVASESTSKKESSKEVQENKEERKIQLDDGSWYTYEDAMKDFEEGKNLTDKAKEFRMKIAKKHGVEHLLTEDNYLDVVHVDMDENFFKQYNFDDTKDVMDTELSFLVEFELKNSDQTETSETAEQSEDVTINEEKDPNSFKDVVNQQAFSQAYRPGSWATAEQMRKRDKNAKSGWYRVPGAASAGICCQNKNMYWAYGAKKSGQVYKLKDYNPNANVELAKKIFYYGPGGPGYIPYSVSAGAHHNYVNAASGYVINGPGQCNNINLAKIYINYLNTLEKVPDDYNVYVIDITGTFAGKLCQDIAFLVKEDAYNLWYCGNGGTYNGNSNWKQKMYAGDSYKVWHNDEFPFKRPGYTWTGWNESYFGNGEDWTRWVGGFFNWGYTRDVFLYAKWEPNQYNITYHGNGGLWHGQDHWSEKVTYNTDYITWQNFFDYYGYEFVGWNEKPDGSGTDWTSSIMKPWRWTYTRDVDLYAQWKPKKDLIVTYHPNGGSGDPIKYTVPYGSSHVVESNPFKKHGYVFLGWSTRPDIMQNHHNVGEEINNITENIDLYARWGLPVYDIVYHFNMKGPYELVTVDDYREFYKGDNYIVQDAIVFRTSPDLSHLNQSYIGDFKNWNTKPDGTGQTYVTYENYMWDMDENLHLYAQWYGTPHNVYYHSGFDDQVVNLGQYTEGESVTIGDVMFKHPLLGKFLHWKNKNDGMNYSPGNHFVMPDKDVHLYAEWDVEYQINYHPNFTGSTASSITDVVNSGDQFTVRNNTFTNNGYKFVGWNTEPGGNGVDWSSKIGTSLTMSDDLIPNGLLNKINLYAQWKPNEYTIKFDYNGYKVPPQNGWVEYYPYTSNAYYNFEYNSDYYYGEGNYGSKPVTFEFETIDECTSNLRVKYIQNGLGTLIFDKIKLDGFELNYEYTSVENPDMQYGFSEWEVELGEVRIGRGKHTLEIYVNPRTTSNDISSNLFLFTNGFKFETDDLMSDIHAKYGDTIYTPESKYKAKYHNFVYWALDREGHNIIHPGDDISNICKNDGDEVTLYAQWVPTRYNVEYNGNGATSGSTPSTSIQHGDKGVISENGFKKDNHIFIGWNTEADGSGTTYQPNDTFENLIETEGTVTLHAQWQEIKHYTIRYHSNYNEDVIIEDLVSTNDLYAIRGTDTFKRIGFTFLDWNESPDGTGASWLHKAGKVEPFNLRKEYPNNIIDLYAQWDPSFFWLEYHANNGSGHMKEYYYYIGQEYSVESSLFDKAGYTFTNWNDSPDGNGVTWEVGKTGIWEWDRNISLYAQWKANNYNVVYHPNGADQTNTVNDTVTYDQDYTVKDNMYSKRGYKFVGWNTKPDKKGENWTDRIGNSFKWDIDSNVDLYAQWQPIEYKVVFDGNGATSGTMADLQLKFDEEGKIPESAYNKTSSDFLHWNTKPDGSGEIYNANEVFKNLSDKDGDIIPLYAIWNDKIEVMYIGNGATSGTDKSEVIYKSDVDKALGYELRKNEKYTDFDKVKYSFYGWMLKSTYTEQEVLNSAYAEHSTNKLTWDVLDSKVDKNTLSNNGAYVLKLYAGWLKDDPNKPITLFMADTKTFYEGMTVHESDITKDAIRSNDGTKPKDVKIVKIEYTSGKLDDAGNKQPAYVNEYQDGMQPHDLLDTWFLHLDKNDSPVTHKVTYRVVDYLGRVSEVVGKIRIIYNEFPVINAKENYYFTLEEAQAGMITKDALLKDAIAKGDLSATDQEEPDLFKNGANIELLDFDANEFKSFTDSGYRRVTYHVQDTYGPNGKGKETIKQITVHVVKDGIVAEVPESKRVRAISKKYYDRNADKDPSKLTEAQKVTANANGGLNVESKWYHDQEYRQLISDTFVKEQGTKYNYTLDDIKRMRSFVETHGIGNTQETTALSQFAGEFLR